MTFVKTALFHKAGEGSGGGGGGGDQHNLGWYATESALTTAHATATDGDWAIVGATDTVWVWDSDSTGWKDTGASGALQNTATGTDSLTILGTGTTTQRSINIGVGSSIDSNNNVAIGHQATIGANTYSNVIAGMGATVTTNKSYNVAIGASSKASSGSEYGVAIGANTATAAKGAIQIGNATGTTKTNSDANTFKVGNANGNYELLSADGTIPEARLADTTNAQQGDVLTLDSNGDAVWQAGGGGGLQNTATGTDSLTILGTASTVNNSTNIGVGSSATGANSTVVGKDASASGNSAVAIGINASATNTSTLALVSGTVSGSRSKGIGTSISGKNSIGITTLVNHIGTMSAQYTVAIGTFNYIDNLDDNSFYVGLGTANADYKLLSSDGTIPTARLTKVNSTITLAAADWSSNTQTVTVTGMTATGVVLVSPDPTDQSAYTSAGILCTAQAADSLTFTATTTPTGDIDVVVVML